MHGLAGGIGAWGTRLVVIGLMALVALAVPVATAPVSAEPSYRGTVFDSKITQRLKVSGQTRSQVRRIASRSGVQLQRVLNKYKINPRKKLNFDKMMKARGELRAVQNAEREAMRKVLTPEQFWQYEQITAQTSAAVTRAMD